MRVTRLDIAGLRRFREARLLPGAGLNLLTGDNGAGKTSVLEALHLMAYGRSFRGRVRDGLVAASAEALEVFVEWETPQPDGGVRRRRAGLRHTGHSWEGRLDGAPLDSLGELCSALAVVTFEPGSHVLVNGGSEPRRRQLDWGLFHVEPDFLPLWRRYSRALRQRNALLKAGARGEGQLESWEHELAHAGEPLGRYRQQYLDELLPHLQRLVAELLPAAGGVRLDYQPGWRSGGLSLSDALLLARDRDLAAGHTSVGPHRGDWRIEYEALPGRESLSRGQAKLTALALLLAQARHHARARGYWPVVALDDLASELDRRHQAGILRMLADSGAQVLITGTEPPPALAALDLPITRFHVEQGELAPVPAAGTEGE